MPNKSEGAPVARVDPNAAVASPMARLEADPTYRNAMKQAVKDVSEKRLTPYDEVRRSR